MRLENGHVLSMGAVVGLYHSHSLTQADKSGGGGRALQQVIAQITRQFSLRLRLAANGMQTTGFVPLRQDTPVITARGDGVAIFVRSGGGQITFKGTPTPVTVDSHWLYVPGGHKFFFRGGTVSGSALYVLYGQLETF